VFHELFGLHRRALTALLECAGEARQRVTPWPANLSYALAPHTLYSLHPDSARELVDAARASGARTSLHLAEHAAERAFLRDGSGPFADFLAHRKVSMGEFVAPGLPPIAYAERLGLLCPELIAVHLCA